MAGRGPRTSGALALSYVAAAVPVTSAGWKSLVPWDSARKLPGGLPVGLPVVLAAQVIVVHARRVHVSGVRLSGWCRISIFPHPPGRPGPSACAVAARWLPYPSVIDVRLC